VIRYDRPAANRLGQILLRRCEVVPITAEVTLQAMYVGERYQISHWDALVVARKESVRLGLPHRRPSGRPPRNTDAHFARHFSGAVIVCVLQRRC